LPDGGVLFPAGCAELPAAAGFPAAFWAAGALGALGAAAGVSPGNGKLFAGLVPGAGAAAGALPFAGGFFVSAGG